MNDGRDQKLNGNFLQANAGAVGVCVTEEELICLKGRTHLKGEYFAVFSISHIYTRMHIRMILLVSLRKNKLHWSISIQNTAHNLFQIQLSHCNFTCKKNFKWNTSCYSSEWKLGIMSADLTDTHKPPPLPVGECMVISLVEDCLSIVWSKTQAPSYIYCQNLLFCHKWCYAYQWILWAPVADSQGSWFFQQVEILLLELETLHAAFKADTSCQMWTNAVGWQCQTSCS